MKLFSRCKHNRIKIHSFKYYTNTSYAVGTCMDCGKPREFKLGFTTKSAAASERVTSDVMQALGYFLKDDTFERPAKK